MKRSKHILLFTVLFLLLLVSFAHRKPALYPGDIRGSIVVEGRERTFILHLPERIIGKTSRDIDANKIIWRFFEDHGHP